MNNHLLAICFIRLSCDVCPYTYDYSGQLYYLNVHIDDIVITGPVEAVVDDLISQIESGFKRITRSEIKRHLGINLVETEKYLKLDQTKYIKEFVEEYLGDGVSTNVKIPMSPTINYRVLQTNDNNPSLLPATGKIRYCADKSRPDILFAINMISTQTEKPHDEFVGATMKLLKYLYSTSSDSLQLGGNDGEIKLFAFSDASYVTDKDARSQLGNCFYLTRDSGAIYSVSKKDNTVSHSSTEAEIKAIDLCTRTILYLRLMLKELGLEQKEPTVIFVDNKSSKMLVETLRSSHKTKHINMRINFIREQVNNRNIQLKFIRSEDQVADVLTKA